jgi:hypothetical protein
MTRWKAAGIHFTISVAIFVLVFGLILYWYSPGLLKIAKADQLIAMITGIDLVLGPMLTLLVFNAKKKSLKFDLGVIALAQLSALVYAVYIAYWARPQFVVAVIDRFELVSALDVKEDPNLEKAKEKCVYQSVWAPCWVGFVMPNDFLGLSQNNFARDDKFFTLNYVNLKEEWPDLLGRAKVDGEQKFLPMQGRGEDARVYIEAQTIGPLKVSNQDPWN